MHTRSIKEDDDTSWNNSFEFRHVHSVTILSLHSSHPSLSLFTLSYEPHYFLFYKTNYWQILYFFFFFFAWMIQLNIKIIQSSTIGWLWWKMLQFHWIFRHNSIERDLNSTYAIPNISIMIMLQYYDKIAYGENVL